MLQMIACTRQKYFKGRNFLGEKFSRIHEDLFSRMNELVKFHKNLLSPIEK